MLILLVFVEEKNHLGCYDQGNRRIKTVVYIYMPEYHCEIQSQGNVTYVHQHYISQNIIFSMKNSKKHMYNLCKVNIYR